MNNNHCPKLPWMIDFFTSEDDSKIFNNQLTSAYAETSLEHRSKLSIKSKVPIFRTTQLICTITSNTTCRTIEELLDNGMSMVRISVPGDEKTKIIDTIVKLQQILENYNTKIGHIRSLALALDIKGPEIRIGKLEKKQEEIYLSEGKLTTFTIDDRFEDEVTEELIFVDYLNFPEVVQPGDKIILENGNIHLSAIAVAESFVRCIVEQAGKLISHSSVILPDGPIDLPSISETDKEILDLALSKSIDYLIVAGIYAKENLHDFQQLLGEINAERIKIITRIDSCLAVDNIDGIIDNSTAIYIDFERLSLHIAKEKLFLIQKSVCAKCNIKGVPVICSAVLNGSVNLSKAETVDIANLVMDGTDAILLSEIASNKSILKGISAICRESEPSIHQKQLFNELISSIVTPNELIYSICISAVQTSMKSSAAAIICLTTSGRTAKLLSRFRPRCPIITITRYPKVGRQLKLYRGIEPLIYCRIYDGTTSWLKDVDERVQLGISYGKYLRYIRMGDAIVIVSSSKPQSGLPNNIKVVYASQCDTDLMRKNHEKRNSLN